MEVERVSMIFMPLLYHVYNQLTLFKTEYYENFNKKLIHKLGKDGIQLKSKSQHYRESRNVGL